MAINTNTQLHAYVEYTKFSINNTYTYVYINNQSFRFLAKHFIFIIIYLLLKLLFTLFYIYFS